MAFSANTAWEVRTTGSDSNGGGFVAGSGGTDYSQQDASQATGTVTSVSTTVTATTGIFSSTMVGNYITDGTTWKQITGYTSSTIITVDSAPSWTAASVNVGGALLTVGKAAGLMVGSNKIFVKSGTYQISSPISLGNATVPQSTSPFNRLIGYYQTRGDIVTQAGGGLANSANRPSIKLITNTGLTALSITASGWLIENFIVDCNSLGTSTGLSTGSNYSNVRNCKFMNFTSQGLLVNSPKDVLITDCEFTGGTSAATAAIVAIDPIVILRCNVHDNVCSGVTFAGAGSNYCSVENCRITNNTGASSDGIRCEQAYNIRNNTIHGNGRHGINNLQQYVLTTTIKGNILSSNGGYGIIGANAAVPADPFWDGNAFYSNTSGARNNMDDTGGAVAINGVAPYTNVLDVILTANPFTNSASGDFTLNNTPGGGAACRAAGTPGAMPGVSQVGYLDMGCFQHQDSGGSTGPVGQIYGARSIGTY